MPKGTPSRREASRATNCPMRVMRKAVRLTVSATHVEGLVPHVLQGAFDHARAADAHADGGVALAGAVERAGHEGVVLHGVGKGHEFWRSQAVVVLGQFGRSF